MAAVKRLSKVARELNVGISTIVDFLNNEGKEVSSNPNTKISHELYMERYGKRRNLNLRVLTLKNYKML